MRYSNEGTLIEFPISLSDPVGRGVARHAMTLSKISFQSTEMRRFSLGGGRGIRFPQPVEPKILHYTPRSVGHIQPGMKSISQIGGNSISIARKPPLGRKQLDGDRADCAAELKGMEMATFGRNTNPLLVKAPSILRITYLAESHLCSRGPGGDPRAYLPSA